MRRLHSIEQERGLPLDFQLAIHGLFIYYKEVYKHYRVRDSSSGLVLSTRREDETNYTDICFENTRLGSTYWCNEGQRQIDAGFPIDLSKVIIERI